MMIACCNMFRDMVKAGRVAAVEEDQWNYKLTKLDGWYLMKRAYDSWWGNYPVGDSFKVCPWCAGELPELYMNDERKYREQQGAVRYATGTLEK